jgi:hypothetical protein
MRRALPLVLFALAVGVVAGPAPAQPAARPQVEVVFVLDTTGSMGPLLDTMRSRIFGIWAQLLGGQPSPSVRVGVVAFRDKGDEYVTRVTDLSPYPDAVYETLKNLKVGGGGDSPEHVNQALDDAVNKISWTPEKAGASGPKTLRMIFLMGDAPPHTDYDDDVDFPVTCKLAVKKGIFVNAVACGGSVTTQQAFAAIAAQGKGMFVATGIDGGTPPPETKYDKRIAELHDALVASYLPYGPAADQTKQRARWAELGRLKGVEAIDRAVLEARLGAMAGDSDLVDAAVRVRERVEPETLPADQLPPALAGKAGAEMEAAVRGLRDARAKLYKEAADLGTKRSAVHRASPQAKATVDGLLYQIIRTQGTKAGIRY